MFGGRDSDSVNQMMGRDGGGKDMEGGAAHGPGRSEVSEEEETTENRKEAEGGLEGG